MKKWIFFSISLSLAHLIEIEGVQVTSTGDSGAGTLRDTIISLNTTPTTANTITFSPTVQAGTITLTSANLPIINFPATISASSNQVIDGGGAFRIFAGAPGKPITLENLTLQNGLALGGTAGTSLAAAGGGGGGLGAGGGVYIDRYQTLTLSNVVFTGNTAHGGPGGIAGTAGGDGPASGGAGASFSIASPNSPNASGATTSGGGDRPGVAQTGGAAETGLAAGTGYGGGHGGAGAGGVGGGNGAAPNATGLAAGGAGGYFGGGGGSCNGGGAGGGGNGGGNGDVGNLASAGGGGIGSGGAGASTLSGTSAGAGGGGGFGGGGGGGSNATAANINTAGAGGGGWGAGGGGGPGCTVASGFFAAGRGGRFGGDGGDLSLTTSIIGGGGGGGAGIGGAIFVGDGAILQFTGTISGSGNSAVGGSGGAGTSAAVGAPGTGYANDMFLLQGASVVLAPTSASTLSLAIQSDQTAPLANIDAGLIVQSGFTTLTSTNNNYRGGTAINAGALSITSDVLGNPSGVVAFNGGFLQTIGNVTTSSRPFTTSSTNGGVDVIGTLTISAITNGVGPGGLNKNNTGTLILTGASTYTQPTIVNAGVLVVNGSLVSPVTVNSGAYLKGTGTITGSVTIENGGTVAPGNSIGTLTTGPITFNSGSFFQVEINPVSASLLDVTGNAALAGSVVVVADPGIYPLGGQYPILTATSITGAFNPTVIGSLSNLQFLLNQIDNTIFLIFQAFPIQTTGLSGNSKKIAKNLNKNASSSTLLLFTGLQGKALKDALKSISPSRNAFGSYIAEQTAFLLSDTLTSHLDSVRLSGARKMKKNKMMAGLVSDASDRVLPFSSEEDELSSDLEEISAAPSNHAAPPASTAEESPDESSRNNYCAWVSGFGEGAHQSKSSQNPAFSYLSGGILTGFDWFWNQKNLVGGALGYAHSGFTESGHAGNGNTNYYFLSAYANYFIQRFYISPAVWGIYDDTHNSRHIKFSGFSDKAKADIFAWQLVPHLEIGYDLNFGRFEVVPFTSVDWAITWQRKYREHGASPFNAKQKAHKTSIVRSETGVKLSEGWQYNWGAFFLQEKVAYVFEKPFGTSSMNMSFVGTPGSFNLTAVNQNLNLAALGLDVIAAVGKRHPTEFKLGYEGEFGSHYHSNQLMLTISKNF